jgi:hypothetical protein
MYPGHQKARTAFEAANQTNRKQFYVVNYRVPNEIATYRRLAALMSQLDPIPEPLSNLADEIERLALA